MSLKIRMRNWYLWGDQTIDLAAPCSSIVGRNGSGKSSIRDALEFAWIGTGALRGAKTKRELAAVAIRDDAETCEVTVECEGVRIRREMDREGKQEVWRSVVESVATEEGQDADHAAIHGIQTRWSNEEPMTLKRDQGNPYAPGCADDLTRCLLEPTAFYNLEPARRQELLVTCTSDPGVTMEAAREAIVIAIEGVRPDLVTVNLDGSPEGEIETMLDAIEDAARWVAEMSFRGAEAAAVERRREAKRDRDATPLGDRPEPMFSLGEDREPLDLSTRPAAEHEASLAERRRDHIAAVELESAGAGAMQGKLTEAKQALAELEAQPEPALELPEPGEGPLEPQPPGEPHELDTVLEAANIARARLTETRLAASAAEANIAEVEALLATPSEYSRPGECPKGPPGMRCPVKPSVWKPAVEKAVGDPTRLEAGLDRLRGELVETNDAASEALAADTATVSALERTRKAWDVFERATKTYQAHHLAVMGAGVSAKAAHLRATTERADAIARASSRVESAQQALEAARQGDPPAGPSAQDLAESISLGERICEASRRFWRETGEWEARAATREKLEVEVSRWDAIAQALKPDGIETKLGGSARETFVAYLDEAAALSGPIRLDDECGVTVEVDRAGRLRHPLQLSESQRLALGIAIQNALCRLTGFPVLISDEIDRFDAEKRAAWARLAESLSSRYPGGVVGIATTLGDPQPPGSPSFQTIWLRPDGSVETLGR